MKGGTALFFCALSFIAGVLVSEGERGAGPVVSVDTLIVRDTVRVGVPVPRVVERVRFDTVRLYARPDTAFSPSDPTDIKAEGDSAAIVPISRRVYVTEDYRATVEGYDPRLVEMELYRKTSVITRTRLPRWALTAGAGVGYRGGEITPYIGVSIGYVLWAK